MNAEVNLYEFNKINMGKLPCMESQEEIKAIYNKLIQYFNKFSEKYFMMLCHEQRDYTIFNTNHKNSIENLIVTDIFECMQNRGYSFIDIIENGSALELWVKQPNTEEAFLFMLFPCAYAVIEY